MFPQNDILNQIRRRRALEPPFATPPIALEQEAVESKSDPWSERLPDGRTVNEVIMGTLRREQMPQLSDMVERGNPLPRTPGTSPLPGYSPNSPPDLRLMQQSRTASPKLPISDPRDPSTFEVPPGYGKPVWEQWDQPINGHTGEYISSALPERPTASAVPGVPPPTGNESRPWKAGTARNETDPLKREAARIRAMIENPMSQVRPDGSVNVPKPMGRLKASLLGALFGLAQGDQNTSLAGRLAAGAAGAGVGAFKPKAVQEWQRRLEVEDAQKQLGDQTKLSAGQAQLDNLRAETQGRLADLMIDPQTGQMVKRPKPREPRIVERTDGVYEISDAHPEGRRVGNIPAEVRRAGSADHYENREDGLYAVYRNERGELTAVKVPGVPGKPPSDAQSGQAAEGEALATSTQQAKESLRAEIEGHKTQLSDNERALREKEKNWRPEAQRRYAEYQKNFNPTLDAKKTLKDFYEEVKAEDPDVQSGGYDELVRNTESFRKLIDDGNKRLTDMDKEIREGQAKGARTPRRSSQSGATLDGALNEFRRQAGREPTAAEVANIKRYYRLQ